MQAQIFTIYRVLFCRPLTCLTPSKFYKPQGVLYNLLLGFNSAHYSTFSIFYHTTRLHFVNSLTNHIAVLFHISQQSTKSHCIFMNATASQQAALSHSVFPTSQWSIQLHSILYEINITTSIAGWVKVGYPSQSTVPHGTHQSLALYISFCCTHTPILTNNFSLPCSHQSTLIPFHSCTTPHCHLGLYTPLSISVCFQTAYIQSCNFACGFVQV